MVPACVGVCELLWAHVLSFVSKTAQSLVGWKSSGKVPFGSVRQEYCGFVVYKSSRNFPFHFDKSGRCCNSPLQQNFTYLGDWGNESKMVTAIPFSWPGLIEKWRSTLLGQSHWSLTGQSDIITRQDILLTQHPVLLCYAFLIARASCPHKQPVRIFGNETSVQFSENLSPRSWLIKLCVYRATSSDWGRERYTFPKMEGAWTLAYQIVLKWSRKSSLTSWKP